MERIEQQFLWALQALAQPAHIQPKLFPSFVVVADELAIDFDNWRMAYESNCGHRWSQEQREVVAALGYLLTEMSGPGKHELWLNEDCLNHPKWAEVRRLALVVLSAFDWSPEIPPLDRAIYARYSRDTEQSESANS